MGDGKSAIPTFRCFRCGKKWGNGPDIESYGLCIECFADWAKTKSSCFGTEPYTLKKHCSLHKYCKEYYGFKQNLSRRLKEIRQNTG
jgi:hypothetical protein